jgi:phosphoenolpyruvate carboxykinase (GTP)
MESFNWTHGVFMGATMGSETTAAATGAVGVVRRDPMAMLPFIGYDAGTYLQHWLSMQGALKAPPKIYLANWFRKDSDGKFLWPGYGENMRVLKWIVDRAHGRADGQQTLLGTVPAAKDLDLSGLDVQRDRVEQALSVNNGEWKSELESVSEWFTKLGPTLPKSLELQRQLLLSRLS